MARWITRRGVDSLEWRAARASMYLLQTRLESRNGLRWSTATPTLVPNHHLDNVRNKYLGMVRQAS